MKNVIAFFLILIPLCSFGQIENRWQPDSVYSNRQVRKMFVYLNSPKDLSEIVEFDEKGKRVRSIKYSASYDRRSRRLKRVDHIDLYQYDSSDRLIRIIESEGADSITFKYSTNGKLISSRKTVGNFHYETRYYYNPLRSTTIRQKDSIIVYEKTKEYEKEFYVRRFFGYYLEPKRKTIVEISGNDTIKYRYSDHNDLHRYEENKIIKNYFDKEGRLVKSDIHSVFMNDRTNEYELHYNYRRNGLLKSIYGYLPRYFRYEYWE